MIDFKHLQGNLVITGTGLVLSGISKKFFKKEFIPISSGKQIGESFLFLMLITILGKKTMDFASQHNLISFVKAQGKDKNPNEGFIGPLKNETIGPKRWDFFPPNK